MASIAAPPHVNPDLVRDFNIFEFIKPDDDIFAKWREQVTDAPPVFYTPEWGGFWIINRGDLLEEAFANWELFTSEDGITIPPSPPEIPKFLPIEADDPFHKQLRRPLNVALSPKGVNELSKAARELAISLIEGLKPKGRCEFVDDFSFKMPMDLFLRIVDLPSDDRDKLIEITNRALKDTSQDVRWAAMAEMNAYLSEWVSKRRENPASDLMSSVVTMQVDGRSLTFEEALGYMTTTLLGGLDTVGGMLAMTARHLAENPEHRRFLIDHPEAIPDAVEEILRRYAIAVVARRVTRDVEFGGAQLKKGEWVMLPTMVHGVDERSWDNAMEVRLDRRPQEMMTFGRGTHRCPGANLARAEIRIFIEEWLRRIPEFSIDPNDKVISVQGGVAGLKRLPLVWAID
jgi:cytochrome P450